MALVEPGLPVWLAECDRDSDGRCGLRTLRRDYGPGSSLLGLEPRKAQQADRPRPAGVAPGLVARRVKDAQRRCVPGADPHTDRGGHRCHDPDIVGVCRRRKRCDCVARRRAPATEPQERRLGPTSEGADRRGGRVGGVSLRRALALNERPLGGFRYALRTAHASELPPVGERDGAVASRTGRGQKAGLGQILAALRALTATVARSAATASKQHKADGDDQRGTPTSHDLSIACPGSNPLPTTLLPRGFGLPISPGSARVTECGVRSCPGVPGCRSRA